MSSRIEGRRSLGAWKGQIFLSVGRALYLGPAGDTTPHAHHALQVCVALETPLRLRHGTGPWQEHDGVVVSPDVAHQLDGGWGDLVLFYIEPEIPDGRQRSGTQSRPIRPLSMATVSAVRRAVTRITSRTLSHRHFAAVFNELMGSAGLEPKTSRLTDLRIERALQLLRARPRARGSLSDLARTVGLSPGRFRHLFREEIGMSAQSYIVWLRIYDACATLAQGASLSDAAYQAGFSDAAHFTRTFRRTFGLAPSQLAGRMTTVETFSKIESHDASRAP